MNDLIDKWIQYIDLESLMQTRIDLSQINEMQFLKLDQTIDDSNGKLSFPINHNTAQLIEDKMASKSVTSSTKRIAISYPYATIRSKGKEYIRPLFIFDISESIQNSLQNAKIELDVYEEFNYAPIIEFFEQDFKIERTSFVDNISFFRQITQLLETQSDNPIQAITNFCSMLMNIKTNSTIIDIKFDTALIHEVETGFVSKKMRESISVLKKVDTSSSILDEYVNKRADGLKNQREYEAFDFFGKFTTSSPLSFGQSNVIKAVSSGKKIVAVQGGPGTGKTSLFLSIIAARVTERALSIIAGRDFNNQMLVVSVANKAIENITEELNKHPKLSQLNDFLFIAGNGNQINASLDNMQKYKDYIDANHFDPAKYSELTIKIKDMVKKIEKKRNRYKQAEAIVITGLSRTNNKSKITAAEEFVARLEEDEDNLEKTFGFTDIDRLAVEINITRLWFKEVREKLLSIGVNAIDVIYDDQPQKALLGLKTLIKTIDLLPWYNFEQITNSRKKLLNKYKKEHSKILQKIFDNIEESDLETFDQIETILNFIIELSNTMKGTAKPHPFFINSQDNLTHVDSFIKNKERESELRHFIASFYSSQETLELFGNNFSEFERINLFKEQEQLFELSIDFLREEQLKRKIYIKNALTHMTSIMSGNKSRRTAKIIYEAGINNFFKDFSLAYPVITTTLASAWNITKDFLYSFDAQNDEEVVVNYMSGFKPINLLLSDESGMTKIHEPVPVLYASDSVVVVGDPKQLPPIYTIAQNAADHFESENFTDIAEAEMFSPTIASFYHRSAGARTGNFDDLGDGIVLDEHRRCQPKIAELFIEVGQYEGLKIKTPPPSDSDLQKLESFSRGENVIYVHRNGERGTFKNTNIDEVSGIRLVLKRLEECGFDIKKDVGIITPYVSQKELLISEFGKLLDHNISGQKIGTIHAFQGAEYKVVIFSTVIFNDSDSGSFLNSDPNILNVAISRAKLIFITVGNVEKLINSGGFLLKIIDKSHHLEI